MNQIVGEKKRKPKKQPAKNPTQRSIFMNLWFIFSITNVQGEEINSKYTLYYCLQKC